MLTKEVEELFLIAESNALIHLMSFDVNLTLWLAKKNSTALVHEQLSKLFGELYQEIVFRNHEKILGSIFITSLFSTRVFFIWIFEPKMFIQTCKRQESQRVSPEKILQFFNNTTQCKIIIWLLLGIKKNEKEEKRINHTLSL